VFNYFYVMGLYLCNTLLKKCMYIFSLTFLSKVLLTVLIGPHLGYVAAVHEADLFTKGCKNKNLGLMFAAPGSKWCCVSVAFRLAFWVCEDLVAGRIHNVFY